ncbi:peptidoglycan editing factor PgeF [Gallaecimonas sp. GXIMD4217]|uniref:peptidoglycan editing factor PgeF n=1 Tax=Gallaecimonas sp. GXIMD4217 TaxID=3131927 RepID=UPI00311AE5F0
MSLEWIEGIFPANVAACFSNREQGVSQGSFAGFNLGRHVGDVPSRVDYNRRVLQHRCGLPAEPAWLDQVHGTEVLYRPARPGLSADGCWTDRVGEAMTVMTADCLPVLLASENGQKVAAVHAGWRGLAAGILPRAIARMGVSPGELIAWVGPAIGPSAFEVGSEVREAFLAAMAGADECFQPRQERFLCDLPGLAQRQMHELGVARIHLSGLCTYSQPQRFYSHRRQAPTGRMASLIWRKA